MCRGIQILKLSSSDSNEKMKGWMGEDERYEYGKKKEIGMDLYTENLP